MESENPANPVMKSGSQEGLQKFTDNPDDIGKMFASNMPKAEAYTKPDIDPSIYVVNHDGTPKLNKYGKPAKKPGRPKKHGQKLEGRQVFNHSSENAQDRIEKDRAKAERQALLKNQSKATAAVCVQTTIATCIMVFGEDWKAEDTEVEGLTQATSTYFEAKGVTDIPPGAALSLALLAYAMPRFAKPKTQSKLSLIKNYIVTEYGGIFGLKPKKIEKKIIPSRAEAEAASK